jgi:uncharacterized protein (TIGR02302 family)
VLLYAALSLFDVWSFLPETLHRLAAAGFAALIAYVLVGKAEALALPHKSAAMRRLEATNALVHRPLDVAEQSLALGAGDTLSEALWRAHRKRAQASVSGLHGFWPRLGLESADPRALRFLILLLLAAGLFSAGPDVGGRLARGFTLAPSAAPVPPPRLDVWIEPPAYTKLPTVFVTRGAENAGRIPGQIGPVPVGSKLSLRVQGAPVPPHLNVMAKNGAHSVVALPKAGSDGYAIARTLTVPAKIAVKIGLTRLAQFTVAVAPDTPPSVAFAGPITQTGRGALRLAYEAADDYGIATLTLAMKLASPSAADTLPVEIELPAPSGAGKTQLHTNLDLTAHPWAGLPVKLTLKAKDGAGQLGESAAQTVTLPERVFNDPLARALIAARKNLMRDPGTVPVVEGAISQVIGALVENNRPSGLTLALSAAYWTLREGDQSDEDHLHAAGLMWAVAIALEDGVTGEARLALDSAKAALADALKSGASQAEIAQRMAELRQALARYLAALQAKMADAMAKGELEVNPALRGISVDEFARLMETLDNLTKTGARGEAQNLLSALDDILQNLTTGEGGAESAGERAGSQALSALGDLIGQQRALMDETFRDAQITDDHGPLKKDELKNLAARQEALRKRLGSLMTTLGGETGTIPQALGQAERAMAGARDALAGVHPREGLNAQAEALDHLRGGAREIAEAMTRAGGAAGGMARGGGMPSSDPFGRPNAGLPDQGDSVKVPSRGEAQRARDILEEIRRRAAERGRPQQELEYLDRLLERF